MRTLASLTLALFLLLAAGCGVSSTLPGTPTLPAPAASATTPAETPPGEGSPPEAATATAEPSADGTTYPAPDEQLVTAMPPAEDYPAPQDSSVPTQQPVDPYAAPVEAANPQPLQPPPVPFDGQRAYQDVIAQVAFGPRTPGSPAHAQAVDWMVVGLEAAGWQVEIQETTRMDKPVRNVIAKRGSGAPWTILGAHYDSRLQADNDPDPANHNQPVPGANDGASGVAVLMEMARVLPEDLQGEIWLAFFDVEDQGRLPGWDWILGSRALADSLEGTPDAVIVVDMIGDADLNIYQEINSDMALTAELWALADQLGYGEQFIREQKYSILDDHTPFLEKGIRAVDIIDFDYPYWHTIADDIDKVAPESLQAVGDVVLYWLLRTHAP